MKSNIELFNVVMEKYRLSDPVTMEHQAFIIKSRKKVLKAILKKYKKFSILFWLTIITALIFRNLGVKLTFIQSKVILAVALTTATAGTSTATYAGAKYIYKHILLKDVKPIEETVPLKELKIDLQRQDVMPGQKIDNSHVSGTEGPATEKRKPVPVVPSM